MAQVRIVVLLSSLAVIASATLASAQSETAQQARENALRRLQAAAGGAVLVSDHKATGAARFISVARGSGRSLGFGPASTAGQKERQSTAFFREYGALLGVTDSNSMRLASTWTDALGETHLAWKQFHRGVPVFAATLNTHFDASHQLKAVTGTAIPDISVSPTPAWSADRAAQVARSAVIAERGDSDALRIARTTLYVYREGLAQGIPGESHLAWEVEVTDGAGIRDMVYVGAHSGKVIDRISAVHDDLFRRAYDGKSLPFVPPNYPNGVYWLEGQPLPTLSQEANNMLVASSETYNLFKQAFGRDSFDGKGATMDAIFDRGYACPNASWNGIFISFCPGLTTDDVTAHEWGHAFTQYTHGLIYAWQSGAAQRGVLGYLGRGDRSDKQPRERCAGWSASGRLVFGVLPSGRAASRERSPCHRGGILRAGRLIRPAADEPRHGRRRCGAGCRNRGGPGDARRLHGNHECGGGQRANRTGQSGRV